MFSFSINKLLLFAVFLLLFLQVDIARFIRSGSTANISLYYFVLAVSLLLIPKPTSVFRNYVTLLFSVYLVFLGIAGWRYGLSIESLRLVIMMSAAYYGAAVGLRYDKAEIGHVLDGVALCVLVVLVVRAVIYPPIMQSTFGSDAALTEYPFLVSGGHNIEVTYLAFLALFCRKKMLCMAVLVFCVLLSILYASRVGAVSAIVVLLYRYRPYTARGWLMTAFFCIILFVSVYQTELVSRFGDIQQEFQYGAEGVGRLGLGQGAIRLAEENPLGYGIGNALHILHEQTGIFYKENNIHNIYLQILVDLGGVSLFCFFFFLVAFIRRHRGHFSKDNFAFGALLYFFLGFIQFTGYDALGWLCVGLALSGEHTTPSLSAVGLREMH